MSDPRILPVPDGLVGERLDVALSRLLGVSRTRAAGLVDEGAVRVNGRPPSRSDRLESMDMLEVRPPDPPTPASRVAEPVVGMTVIYEDPDIVVVDKPVGVAAHPSPGWEGPTVTGALAAGGHELARLGAAERQGVVHRLDVGTSGVMVLAKSAAAYSDLKSQFKRRIPIKLYHAVVQGHPDPSEGTIDAPIGRHPRHDYRWAVVAAGRPSVTHYTTVEAFRHASLLQVRLETGRTHQIRVHMAAIHHPCAGDLTYGADPSLARRLGLSRQWLHAVSLTIEHPVTGRAITFTSEYPDDLATALDRLRQG